MNKAEQLDIIHESLVNGQRRQMTNQIEEYGLYDFWSDYADYLRSFQEMDTENGFYKYFKDAVISYFHNRV